MQYNLFLTVIVIMAVAFPVGIILAFDSGQWQWLTFSAVSALFFHLALK
jgi:hypothetical protein